MTLLSPFHWNHSRADIIWPVGPFKISTKNMELKLPLIKGILATLPSKKSHTTLQFLYRQEGVMQALCKRKYSFKPYSSLLRGKILSP